ncbi:MAG: hypothetical protein ACE5KP_00585 [Dehalococcoidales bacterium]
MRAFGRYLVDRKISLVLIFLIVTIALLSGYGLSDEAPTAPTGLSVEREEFDPANSKLGDKAFLTWNLPSADNIKAYRIYRSDQLQDEKESKPTGYELIGTTEVNSFTDTELYSDLGVVNLYHYQVSAIDEAGNESLPSSEVSFLYSRWGQS